MPTNNFPSTYTQLNANKTKLLNLVLEIDGLSTRYSIAPTYSTVTYGMAGLTYGLAGLVYGGNVIDNDTKPYISMESTLTISQRLEPEQGRASISQMSLVLIDKDGEVSNVVSPGGTALPEILGRAVTIRVGYQASGYPDDYYVAYRGIITTVTVQSGRVTLQFGDANQKRRSAVFKLAKETLDTAIIGSPTTIFTQTDNFYQIGAPGDPVDANVKCYLAIEDEVIQYGQILTPGQITAITRGQRGTVAADHAAGVDIQNTIQLEGHPMTLALKIMLSGWNGPYLSGETFQALGTNGSVAVTNGILLEADKDADLDYGLTVGDTVIVTDPSLVQTSYTITAIEDGQGRQNRVLRTSTPTPSVPVATGYTLAFRSQFDTLPVLAGLKLSPRDVDVAGHLELKNTDLVDAAYYMQLYVQSQQVGKEFIEQQLYLPIGCYSLTRFGRLSVNITKTPLASSLLQFLTVDNILDPEQITEVRGMNTRKFFNEIQYNFDQADDGRYLSVRRSLDTTSLNQIGILQLLPISSNGLKTAFGADTLIATISTRLLDRYKRAAYEIKVKTNFETGSLIEVGDVVALYDNGTLHLTNFFTGERDLGTTLFEVIDRSLDVKTGVVSLGLISGQFGSASDRFGTISPSSIVTTGSTTTTIRISPSYGAALEELKWEDYIGQQIMVRNDDWTSVQYATLDSIDTVTSPVGLVVSPALSVAPSSGYKVEVPEYPTSANPKVNQLYKVIHCFCDPTVPLTGGSGQYAFTVSAGNIGKFLVNAIVKIRDATWTSVSPEVKIVAVDAGTNTVTVDNALGFTPTSSYYADLVGFADGGAGYRVY